MISRVLKNAIRGPQFSANVISSFSFLGFAGMKTSRSRVLKNAFCTFSAPRKTFSRFLFLRFAGKRKRFSQRRVLWFARLFWKNILLFAANFRGSEHNDSVFPARQRRWTFSLFIYFANLQIFAAASAMD